MVVWRRFTGGPPCALACHSPSILLLVVAARSSRGAQRSPSDTFEALVQRYIEVRRDAGALSRAAIDTRAEGLKRLLREVQAIDPVVLSAEQRIDHATVVGQLEGTIFDLDVAAAVGEGSELYLQDRVAGGSDGSTGRPRHQGSRRGGTVEGPDGAPQRGACEPENAAEAFHRQRDLPGRRVAQRSSRRTWPPLPGRPARPLPT